jgi:PBP1b-binding outer membrane lipoprotein LpoB
MVGTRIAFETCAGPNVRESIRRWFMSSGKSSIAIAVAAIALLSAACTERQPEQSVTNEWPTFQEADKDGSGALDSKEAASITGLNFTAADIDYDGKISESEYEVVRKNAHTQAKNQMGG